MRSAYRVPQEHGERARPSSTEAARGAEVTPQVCVTSPPRARDAAPNYFPEDLLARWPRGAVPPNGAILTSDGANSRHPP